MPKINEIYAFIERADTIRKAVIAAEWLKEHRNALSAAVYDELMRAVEVRMKDIFRKDWNKTFSPDGRLVLVEKSTGEVIAEL